jgi:uncharacterized protein YaaW (UPF0174 family)
MRTWKKLYSRDLDMDELQQGLYDLLVTDELHQQLDETLLEATFEKISEANLPERLASALAERLASALAERLVQSLNGIKASKSNTKAAEQVAWVNQLLTTLQQPPVPGNINSPPPQALQNHLNDNVQSISGYCTVEKGC